MQHTSVKQWKNQSKKSKPETYICKICFKQIEDNSLHSLIYKNPTICNDCFNKTNPIFKTFKFHNVKALAIYPYDEFIKSNLYQLKGCYDIELAKVFLEYFKSYLAIKYHGYILIPAPSAKEADEERGFNHVSEIFKSLPNEQISCIKKINNIKQSSLSKSERSNIKNNLEYVHIKELKNQKVLLVDDVFTTGSTMEAMLNIIKHQHPKKIEILVMSIVEQNE